MSKLQFEAFYKKVGQDEALKNKLMALRGDIHMVQDEIVKIAREKGFDVEQDDFVEAFKNDTGKLDDEVLDAVAGGCYWGKQGCIKVCGECCGTFLGTYIGQQ